MECMICFSRNELILSWPLDLLELRFVVMLIISAGFVGLKKKVMKNLA